MFHICSCRSIHMSPFCLAPLPGNRLGSPTIDSVLSWTAHQSSYSIQSCILWCLICKQEPMCRHVRAGAAGHAAGREGHNHLHRRNCVDPGRRKIRIAGVPQICPARSRSVPGQRVPAAGTPWTQQLQHALTLFSFTSQAAHSQ